MFKIRKKRLVLSALVAAGLILPAGVFAVNNLAKTNNSFAESYSTMQEAAEASGIYDVNLWGCIVRGKYPGSTPGDSYHFISMTKAELATISTLDCPGATGYQISNIEGLRNLSGLKSIDLRNQIFVSFNLGTFPSLETVDLSGNTNLHTVSNYPANRALKDVNLSGDSNLTNVNNVVDQDKNILRLDGATSLTSLNLTGVSKLPELSVYNTGLTTLNLSSMSSLERLNANESELTSITLPNTSTLDTVGLYNNNLSSITMPSSCGITALNLRDNSRLSSISGLSNCKNLKSLAIINDNFSSIDISGNPNLIALKAKGNSNLKKVNITNNTKLANIQLGTSKTSDAYYIEIDTVQPVVRGTSIEYDFSDYQFINSNTAFANSSAYSVVSLDKLNVTDYSALETDSSTGKKYVHVQQTSTPVSDTNDANNGELTFVNNFYRVLLNKADEGQTFTITYNTNGGSGQIEPTSCTTEPNKSYCMNILTTSVPIRNGYTFLGWDEDPNATEPAYEYGITTAIDALESNKTLYAIWEKDAPSTTEYTLTFNANNGTGAPSSQKCTANTGSSCTITISNTTPTRSGYTFAGWSDSASGSAIYQQGQTITMSGNKTIYAVWEEDTPSTTKYTLTYNANNGSGAPSSQECTASVGSTCEITISYTKEPTRTGYDFKGWSDSASGSAIYQQGQTITMNKNKTIYAIWTKNDTPTEETTKTLTFDPNNGIGDISPEKCTSDGPCDVIVPKENAPTRNGYKFAGWATKKDATKADYKPGDTVTLEDDLTLYAVWVEVDETPAANGSAITPDTGANTNNNDNGVATIIIASPILVACLVFGAKFVKSKKHIKFD